MAKEWLDGQDEHLQVPVRISSMDHAAVDATKKKQNVSSFQKGFDIKD